MKARSSRLPTRRTSWSPGPTTSVPIGTIRTREKSVGPFPHACCAGVACRDVRFELWGGRALHFRRDRCGHDARWPRCAVARSLEARWVGSVTKCPAPLRRACVGHYRANLNRSIAIVDGRCMVVRVQGRARASGGTWASVRGLDLRFCIPESQATRPAHPHPPPPPPQPEKPPPPPPGGPVFSLSFPLPRPGPRAVGACLGRAWGVLGACWGWWGAFCSVFTKSKNNNPKRGNPS